jgi:hypothetical protein
VGYYASGGSCTACPAAKPYAPVGSMSSSACVALCPDSTWTLWLDTQGVEGLHSCFKRFSTSVSYAVATGACQLLGSNVHLPTARQVWASVCGLQPAVCRACCQSRLFGAPAAAEMASLLDECVQVTAFWRG